MSRPALAPTTPAPPPVPDATRRSRAERWWPWLLLALVVVVRSVPTLDASRPVVMEDELGYLLNARFLAGVGGVPSFGEMGSYQGGWSLLLVPLWWVLEEPNHVYRAAVCLAAALGALAMLPCAGIARRAGAGPRAAWAVGAVAVLLPGPVLMGGYAYAEGVLTLLLALVVLAAMRYAESPSTGRAALVAALAVAAHVCHGRAIAVPLLVLAWGVLGLASSGRRSHGLAAVVVAAAGGLAGVRANDWLVERLYDVPFDRLDRGVGILADLDGRFLLSLAGQLWYAGATSLGLGLVGLLLLLVRGAGEVRARRAGPWTFTTGVVTSVLTISALAFVPSLPDPVRLDYFAYGRYADSVAPVLVVVALARLAVVPRAVLPRLLPLVLVPAGLAGVVHLGWDGRAAVGGDPAAPLSMPGVAVWLAPGFASIPWVTATAVGAVTGAVLLVLATRDRRLALLGVAVVCVALAVAGEVRAMRPFDTGWRDLVALDAELRALAPATLTYDTSEGHLYGQNSYQFWLPRTRFVLLDLSRDEPRTDLVLSSRGWSRAERLGARRVAAEVRLDQALWVMPGPLQDDLAARGWLEVPEGEVLPPAAKVTSLVVEDVRAVPVPAGLVGADAAAGVVLDLGHSGTGAVWTPLGTRSVPTGTVRVLGTAVCDGVTSQGVGDLPSALVPGERARVEVLVPVPEDASCSIILQALEEGVAPFGEAVEVVLG